MDKNIKFRNNEIGRLNKQLEWIAKEVLIALSGVVCTPEEGYIKAGLNWLVNDIKQLVSQYKELTRQSAKNILQNR
jgi:hypothetical protein